MSNLLETGDPNHVSKAWINSLPRNHSEYESIDQKFQEFSRENRARMTELNSRAALFELMQINKKLREQRMTEQETRENKERIDQLERELNLLKMAKKYEKEIVREETEAKYSGYISPEELRAKEQRLTEEMSAKERRLKEELESRADRQAQEARRETESKYRSYVSPEQMRKFIEETAAKTTMEARKGYIIEEEVKRQAEEARKKAEEEAIRRAQEASNAKEKEMKYKALRATVEYTGATADDIAEALPDKVVAKSKLEKTVEEFDKFRKIVENNYERTTEKPKQPEPRIEAPKPEKEEPVHSSSSGRSSNSGPIPLFMMGIAGVLFLMMTSNEGRTSNGRAAIEQRNAQQVQYSSPEEEYPQNLRNMPRDQIQKIGPNVYYVRAPEPRPQYEQPKPVIRYALSFTPPEKRTPIIIGHINREQPQEKLKVIRGSFTPKNQTEPPKTEYKKEEPEYSVPKQSKVSAFFSYLREQKSKDDAREAGRKSHSEEDNKFDW